MHRPIAMGVIQALHEIFSGTRGADKVIEQTFKQNRKWGSRDRRQFAETVYDLVRWWRRDLWLAGIDWPAEDRPPLLETEALWRVLGIYAAAKDLKIEGAPTVRRRDGEPPSRAGKLSFPDWLDERASREVPDWDQVGAILNEPAPVFLRANRLRTERENLSGLLQAHGFATEALGADGLRLRERANVFSVPEFKQGLFEVQDLHSQRVAPFLRVEPGQRVIDACAGAGGKTLHLAALMKNKGKIIALDTSDKRLAELAVRSRRSGSQIIEIRKIDSTKVTKRLEDSADRVLLDVPCAGLGVLRRNPDAKWRMDATKLEGLLALQKQILTGYSAMVRKGGLLVYATCSILRSENQDQVRTFLEASAGAFELEEEIVLSVESQGGDGFYAARLRRMS